MHRVNRSRSRSILAIRSSSASLQHCEARTQKARVGGASLGRKFSTSPISDSGMPTVCEARMNANVVEEITGTRARTFRDWARDHASDFRPRSPAEVVSRHVAHVSKLGSAH